MKIDYNIISKGTERSGSKGYMAVSEKIAGKRYLMPLAHEVRESKLTKDFLIIKKDITEFEVAIARFRLISELFLSKHSFKKNSKILVYGAGCVGYGLLTNLYTRGYYDVHYTTRKTKPFHLYEWKETSKVDITDYDIIFDTTGHNEVVENIINNAKPMTKIVLLGTPRQKPNIDVLVIHRKNLEVYGGHELFGYTAEYRQKIFDQMVNQIVKHQSDYSAICGYAVDAGIDDKIYNIIKGEK